jgi:adenylosuccinate lyase
MPQKVNPITFENAEGVLQMANAQFDFYSRKLISSRLQRDLSDSTVRRTFGIAFAYTVLGWKSVMSGLKKVSINEVGVKKELNTHWEILSEAVQTYLRSVGDDEAYEKLKELTRGKQMTKETYLEILRELRLNKEKKFTDLTPEKYIGLAEKLTEKLID